MHVSLFTCISVKMRTKTRVPSLSVQRSLRGSGIKTIARGCVRRTGSAIRQAYETSEYSATRRERPESTAVEYLNVTSRVIGLGLRDTARCHVLLGPRAGGVP